MRNIHILANLGNSNPLICAIIPSGISSNKFHCANEHKCKCSIAVSHYIAKIIAEVSHWTETYIVHPDHCSLIILLVTDTHFKTESYTRLHMHGIG